MLTNFLITLEAGIVSICRVLPSVCPCTLRSFLAGGLHEPEQQAHNDQLQV